MTHFYLIKTDSVGDTLWTRTYGGDDHDCGDSVDQTRDGGYIIAGHTESYGAGEYDVYVVRTDQNGDTLWTSVYGGEEYDWGHSVQQTDDGGYIVAGYLSTEPYGTDNAWLIRLGSDGAGLNISLTPQNPPIIIPPGGGSFVFDFSIQNAAGIPFYFDAWTEAVLPDGRIFGPIFERTGLTLPPGGGIERQVIQYVPACAPSGDFTYTGIAGITSPYSLTFSDGFEFEKLPGADLPGHNEGWAVSGWGIEETPAGIAPKAYALHQNHPNPFNPVTEIRYDLREVSRVKLEIFNIMGQKIYTLVDALEPAGYRSAVWNGLSRNSQAVASGIYLYRLTAEGQESGARFTRSAKMLLLQ